MEKITENTQIEGCGIATMIRPIKVIIILLSFLLALPSVSIALQFKVKRVLDGDTILVVWQNLEIKVRLVGIDAPEVGEKKHETGQLYGRKATKYLAKLVLNKNVRVEEYGSDRYARMLGVVFVNGTNVNLEMVRLGLAEVYRGRLPRYFNPKIYQEAEAEAKRIGIGIWYFKDKYVSPMEWRKMRRKDN